MQWVFLQRLYMTIYIMSFLTNTLIALLRCEPMPIGQTALFLVAKPITHRPIPAQ